MIPLSIALILGSPDVFMQEGSAELIKRLTRNLEDAASQLERDPGQAVQRTQQQIIDDLERLIRQQGPASSPPAQKSQSEMPPAVRESSPSSKAKSGTSTTPTVELGPWGELPRTERDRASAFSLERLMPKYEDLLREYYRSIADRSGPVK